MAEVKSKWILHDLEQLEDQELVSSAIRPDTWPENALEFKRKWSQKKSPSKSCLQGEIEVEVTAPVGLFEMPERNLLNVIRPHLNLLHATLPCARLSLRRFLLIKSPKSSSEIFHQMSLKMKSDRGSKIVEILHISSSNSTKRVPLPSSASTPWKKPRKPRSNTVLI